MKTLTNTAKEYIEELYRLQTVEPDRLKTTQIAKRLHHKPASITEMLQRLSKDGYIDWRPYKPIKLTKQGIQTAKQIIRSHRLIEKFLTDVLKMSSKQSHYEARRISRVVSFDFLDRLDTLLKSPSYCPHGNPIPKEDGSLPNSRGVRLTSVSAPQTVELICILDENDAYFQMLKELELNIGSMFRVIKRINEEGPIVISHKGNRHILDNATASNLYVLPKRDQAT